MNKYLSPSLARKMLLRQGWEADSSSRSRQGWVCWVGTSRLPQSLEKHWVLHVVSGANGPFWVLNLPPQMTRWVSTP